MNAQHLNKHPVSRIECAKTVPTRRFISPALIGLLAATTLTMPMAIARTTEATSSTCPSWFALIRERIFMHYNYIGKREGIVAITQKEFNAAWLRVAAFDLRKNANFLATAIKERHPQIAFLERLGFKFNATKNHYIPSMNEIGTRIGEMMNELVATGRVTSDDVLKPMRMFRTVEDGKSRIVAVALDADPPLGATPVQDLASDKEFWAFVAEGNWPIGEMIYVDDSGISAALHDLGHIGAFVRNPEFMASLRNFARTRIADDRLAFTPNKLTAILESLSLGKTQSRPGFLDDISKLGIKRTGESAAWTPERFEQSLRFLSSSEIASAVSRAHEKRFDLFTDLGGARNDIFSTAMANAELARAGRSILENPHSLLEQAFNANNPEVKRVSFAKYLSAMDHTTQIEPADWLKELTNSDSLKRDSKIYKYLCTAGIYSYKSFFYGAFCRDSKP